MQRGMMIGGSSITVSSPPMRRRPGKSRRSSVLVSTSLPSNHLTNPPQKGVTCAQDSLGRKPSARAKNRKAPEFVGSCEDGEERFRRFTAGFGDK